MTGRIAWSAADQAISSATNFFLALMVARSTTLPQFGEFSIVFTTYVVLLSLARAATSEPLLVRFSARPTSEQRMASRTALGVAFVLSLLCSALLLMAGALVGESLAPMVWALAAVLPFLMVQDLWRFVFLTAREPGKAARNDALWAMAEVGFIILAFSMTSGSAAMLMLAWGAGAGVAAAAGFVQAKLMPAYADFFRWWSSHRDLIPHFSLEAVTGNASRHGLIYVIGALAGVAAAGKFRAAELILAPLNVIILGAVFVGIPEGTQLLRAEAHRVPGRVVMGASGLALLTLLWGGLASLLPSDIGTTVLGPVWLSARSILIPLTIGVAATAANAAFNGGMRVFGSAKRTLRAGLVAGPTVALGVALGSSLGGGTGAAYAFAAAACLTTIVYARQFKKAAAEWLDAEGSAGVAVR